MKGQRNKEKEGKISKSNAVFKMKVKKWNVLTGRKVNKKQNKNKNKRFNM